MPAAVTVCYLHRIRAWSLQLKQLFAVAVLLLSACNREQAQSASESVSGAAQVVGKTYLTSNRDNVIKNWQSKVADTDECAPFKARLKAAGERHESAASGAFVNDMTKVWNDAKGAGCQHRP